MHAFACRRTLYISSCPAAAAAQVPACTWLCSLEGVLSKAWHKLRELIAARGATELAERETALAERERAAEEAVTCSLCMDEPKAIVFGCGHQTCATCSGNHAACPFCRQPITTRITLYRT